MGGRQNWRGDRTVLRQLRDVRMLALRCGWTRRAPVRSEQMMTFARDDELLTLETRIAKRSAGHGNSYAEVGHQGVIESERKASGPPPNLSEDNQSGGAAIKGSLRHPCASRPGVVVVTSGRNEALVAFDAKMSARSLGDESSCSAACHNEELQESSQDRKADAQPSLGGPRATPGEEARLPRKIVVARFRPQKVED